MKFGKFKAFIRSSAGIVVFSCYEKYLELSALVGRSKTKTFVTGGEGNFAKGGDPDYSNL
jgi:hypothetical protein